MESALVFWQIGTKSPHAANIKLALELIKLFRRELSIHKQV